MTSRRGIEVLVVCCVIAGVVVAATTVAAAQTDVQISSVSVTPNETVTGGTVTVETTITNLESTNGTVDVTDIYVRTDGSTETHGRIEDVGSISPGGSISIPMKTTFESAGQKRLTVHVVVRDESDDYHSYEHPIYVDVEDPVVKADLSTIASANESGRTEVVLTNYGNTDLTDVEVAATADGATFDRTFMFDVPPGSSESTTFDTENVSAERIAFTATYTAAGDSHDTSHTTTLQDVEGVAGEIRLTGVEATRSGTHVTIEGDAANLGSTDTESVLVRIPEGDYASPVSPSGEYFIGAVEASKFATFDLTGEVEPDASSVPVEITYIVDGERVTTTQDVDIGSVDPSGGGRSNVGADDEGPAGGPNGPERQPGSSGLPLIPIVAVLVLAMVGVVVYRWRQQ